MAVSVEIHFQDVARTPGIEELIRRKVAKLAEVCEDLMWCRVAVEQPNRFQRTGSPFQVRIEMGIPGYQPVVRRESSEGDLHDTLPAVLRDAFRAARLLLQEIEERRRTLRRHPAARPEASS